MRPMKNGEVREFRRLGHGRQMPDGWQASDIAAMTHHEQYSTLIEKAPMLLIGILGAAGSGKSTAAQILCEHHGFARMRMAETLKAMLRTAGLTDEQIDGDQKEVPCEMLCGRTPRWAMQSLGTEWARDCIGADFWIRVMEARLDRSSVARVVIDDIRYPNELEMIRRRGGIIAKIRRPEVEDSHFGGHVSEAFWRVAEADAVIWNDGDMATLGRRLAAFLPLEIAA